jgi:hypothetical protein
MKHSNSITLVLCLLSLLLFSSGIIRHDVSEDKYKNLAKEKQFDCVGQIYQDTTVKGSCVLINSRFALSAAHVFIDSEVRNDTVQMNGESVINFVPVNERVSDVHSIFVVINGQKIRAKKMLIHPNYRDSLTKGSCDLALIELEAPVNSVSIPKLNTRLDELNSNVTGVGFGASGSADRPDLVGLFNTKIAGENVIDSIGGPTFSGNGTLLYCDFDHPTRNDCNKMGSSDPRPLEYISSGGDSGGGLFRKNGNDWELIGICAEGGIDIAQFMKTYYYGQVMGWTRVSLFADWISSNSK